MDGARTITFVTGNSGKFATAREHLEPFGIALVPGQLHLEEIQSPSVRDVALHKARQAFGALRSSLIVHDSGFEFDELGGWPGPMVRQLVDAVGAQGVAHIADLTATRACGFVSILVYVDADGAAHEFSDDGNRGTIVAAPAAGPKDAHAPEAWSPLWQVFVPDGSASSLAELDDPERERLLASWQERSAFSRFGNWLSAQAPDGR